MAHAETILIGVLSSTTDDGSGDSVSFIPLVDLLVTDLGQGGEGIEEFPDVIYDALYSAGYNVSKVLLRSDISSYQNANTFAVTDEHLGLKFKNGNGNASVLFLIDEDDDLYVIGANSQGALGLSEPVTSVTVLTYVTDNVDQVATSSTGHSMILKKDGTVWTTGNNGNGQLGLDDTDDRFVFTEVTDLPSGTINKIEANYYNSYLGTDTGIYSCGHTSWNNGHSDGIQYKTFEQCPGTSGLNIVDLSCGNAAYQSLALTSSGNLYSCGNDNGTYGMTLNGVAGGGYEFQQVQSGTVWTKVMAVQNSSVVLNAAGEVWGAGQNGRGELGLGTTSVNPVFTQLATSLGTIIDISAGSEHIGLITSAGEVYLAGYNNHLQLARGAVAGDTTLFVQEDTAMTTAIKFIKFTQWGSFVLATT